MRDNLYDGPVKSQSLEGRSYKAHPPRLMFVAPQQTIYQCLCSALQDHFHETEVFLVDRIDDGLEPDHGVRLVLLGAGARSIGRTIVDQCHRQFPGSAVAIAVDSGRPVVDPQIVEQKLVQGILPTTLPLDVWFALMRLVMAGGEYLPDEDGAGHAGPAHRMASIAPSGWPAAKESGPYETPLHLAEEPVQGAENSLKSLTAREREILKLVSEGYQNKLIADRMALSEHTVKAHVHNLIAKLRVTNRTQAAAYLHEHGFYKDMTEPGSGPRRRATVLS